MRHIEFEVVTRFSLTRRVICYEDTWLNHIVARGKAFFPGAQYLTIETLENPSFVCRGTSRRDYVLFVRKDHGVVVDSQNGPCAVTSPFVVIVDPGTPRAATLVTVGFRRDIDEADPSLNRLSQS